MTKSLLHRLIAGLLTKNILAMPALDAQAASARIKAVSVDTKVMPLGNASGMTDAERRRLGAWIEAGGPR